MHRRSNRVNRSRTKRAKKAKHGKSGKSKWSHLIKIVKEKKGKSKITRQSSKKLFDESDWMIDDMRKVGWAKASALSDSSRKWLSGLSSKISGSFPAARQARPKIGSLIWSPKSLQEKVLAETKHLGQNRGIGSMMNAARRRNPLRSGVRSRINKVFQPLKNRSSSSKSSQIYFNAV